MATPNNGTAISGNPTIGTPGPLGPNYQAARLITLIWVLAVLAGLLMGLRLFCKIWKSRGLWWDDHVLIVSWVACVIAGGLSTEMAKLGVGRHIWEVPPEVISRISFYGQIVSTFSIPAGALSKTSFALTLTRLFDGWMKGFLWFIIVTINLSLGLAAVFSWTHCSPVERLWNPMAPGTCWDDNAYIGYHIFAGAYAGLMDVVLALLPWFKIRHLMMRKREKFGTGIAMSLGILAGVTAAIKTMMLHWLAASDFLYSVGDLMVWAHVEITTTIMAASIPVLRLLLKEIKKSSRTAGSRSRSNYYKANSQGGMFSDGPKTTTEVTSERKHSTTKSKKGHTKTDSGEGIYETKEVHVEHVDAAQDPYGKTSTSLSDRVDDIEMNRWGAGDAPRLPREVL